jgi:hypothetical protein
LQLRAVMAEQGSTQRIQSKAKVYCDVNVVRPKDYWDYESIAVQWGCAPSALCLRLLAGGSAMVNSAQCLDCNSGSVDIAVQAREPIGARQPRALWRTTEACPGDCALGNQRACFYAARKVCLGELT